MQFTGYVTENVRRLNLSADHLRQAWGLPQQRNEIIEQLRCFGIDPAHLAAVTYHEEADTLDLLLHVAYNAPLVSRRQRAEQLRQKKANFLNTFTPAARQILDELLEKYADYGVSQFDDLSGLLRIQPFAGHGSPSEIYALSGGAAKLVQAVDALQKGLYEP
ncbi:MAG: type I restriction-modification enzyme R subunit C-terminal domain-containing protein [Chloroflexota bacterium]